MITNHPQKDQSGNTMSRLDSSAEYRNNGGGRASGPWKSLDLTTGRSSQSNIISRSGNLPGYNLKSCNIPHKVNISLVCIAFLYFSTYTFPFTITSLKCAVLRARSIMSLLIPFSFHGRKSSWIHRKNEGQVIISDELVIIGLCAVG